MAAHTALVDALALRLGERELNTPQGSFLCTAFRDRSGGLHLALRHGQWAPGDEVILLEPAYDSYAPAVQLAGGTRSVNRALEAKARALAGIMAMIGS